MSSGPHEITNLLLAANEGDEQALNNLVPLVYETLRERAAAYMQRERRGHTLQPTALVHEVYLRIVDQTRVRWKDRRHFFAIAATMMRRILVDYAREQQSARRGGGRRRVSLEEAADEIRDRQVDVLALNDALKKLESWNRRLGRVAELRYFAGLTVKEVSEELEVDTRTVERDWKAAKALLAREMGGDGP